MIRIIAFCISLTLSVLFYFAYYERYFKWRNCFNELGRCYDSETATVYTEAGGFWLIFALMTSIVASYQLWRILRQ